MVDVFLADEEVVVEELPQFDHVCAGSVVVEVFLAEEEVVVVVDDDDQASHVLSRL